MKHHLIHIKPQWDERVFGGVDQMGVTIMGDDNIDMLEFEEEQFMEVVVTGIALDKYRDHVGSTDVIYYSPTEVWKMMYIRVLSEEQPNLIASILHPEHHTVRGAVVLMKMSSESMKFLSVEKGDVVKLLLKRRFHTGLKLGADSTLSCAVIDNQWNLEDGESLSSYTKAIVPVYNYFLLVLYPQAVSSDAESVLFDNAIVPKYIFNLLDRNKKVIADMTAEEWKLLQVVKDKVSDSVQEDSAFSPYHHLLTNASF